MHLSLRNPNVHNDLKLDTYSPTSGYGGADQYWPQLVSPYIQKANGTGQAGQALLSDLSGVFLCPDSTYNAAAAKTFGYGNITSYGISDDLVGWWAPNGVPSTYIGVPIAEVQTPSSAIMLTETYDWVDGGQLPGTALALSYFDSRGGIDGAVETLAGRHNAAYQKTSVTKSADPNSINNVAFCDGHVKAMHLSQLTTSGQYWSISGNDMWP
jgi:prepilin-type processing-associated H-X9-DG protein